MIPKSSIIGIWQGSKYASGVLSKTSFNIRNEDAIKGHPFSTYAKSSEKLILLTPPLPPFPPPQYS